ncbi:MAG: hypothetical protein KKA42_09935 [candidate division Zixibacteria bacterium]|nr:hypothetical protein [candidate division Zixibacteria bacterium]
MRILPVRGLAISFLLAALVLASSLVAQETLPASQAGEIGSPTGKIAFIRDRNIWTMDAHGGHQMLITTVGNADGRLSWAPDGKRIAFTRSGMVDLKAPDHTGGKHKVYDIFLAFVDSAETGNTGWWLRITDDMGGRDPEWSADGSVIVYTKDMEANAVNAVMPNYQVCLMEPEGGGQTVLRKDWQNMTEFFTSPTMNANGDIVFVHMHNREKSGIKPRGIARLHKDRFMASVDSVYVQSSKLPTAIAPSFSPDGKWVAWVNNSMTESGLYISPADLSKSYLVYAPPPGVSVGTSPPSFSPDSKWLTFATSDGSVWIVKITGSGAKRLTGPGLDWAPAWSK